MRELFAHRDARVYIIGQTFSAIGDYSLWLAMGVWVKILSGSNGAAGLTFLAFTCGLLLSPVCGLVVDRVRRGRLLLVANLLGAIGICTLLTVHHRGQIWIIYLVMFGYGIINSFITTAQTALIATIIPVNLLGTANSALQMASQGLRIVTPLIGAGIFAWAGPKPVILLDAASFLVGAVAIVILRLREDKPASHRKPWAREMAAGILYIKRTPVLTSLLVAGVAALFAIGFINVVLFAVVAQGLHETPPFYGVLSAGMGAGAVIAGFLAAPVIRRAGEARLISLGLSAGGVSCLLLMAVWPAVAVIAMAPFGLSFVWFNVGATTLIQRLTPAELVGRVDAAITMAITIPQALAVAVGAALIAEINYRVILIGMAVVLAASGGYLAMFIARNRPDEPLPPAHDEDVEETGASHRGTSHRP